METEAPETCDCGVCDQCICPADCDCRLDAKKCLDEGEKQ